MPLPTNPAVNSEAVDDDGILKVYREAGGDRAWVIAGDTPLSISAQRPGSVAADYATTASLVATFDATAQTLTADANGVLTTDGGNPLVTDLVLAKDQVNPARRYIYEVQDVGSATTPWVMRVWPEMNESSELFDGAQVYVTKGTQNVNTTYRVDVAEPFVFGGSALNWVVSGAASETLEIGRGNALPLDNSDFQLFILEGHATLPSGQWWWSIDDSQWYEA